MSDPKAMQVAAEVRALSDRQTGDGVHTSSVAGAMIAEAARLSALACGDEGMTLAMGVAALDAMAAVARRRAPSGVAS
jgi:uncharacterized protein (TIGR03382 family)